MNEIFYGLGGNQCDESSAFCKEISTKNKTHYFIMFVRNMIFDPYGAYPLKRSDKDFCKYKQVSSDCFNNYIRYLKTKNHLYFVRSERESR